MIRAGLRRIGLDEIPRRGEIRITGRGIRITCNNAIRSLTIRALRAFSRSCRCGSAPRGPRYHERSATPCLIVALEEQIPQPAEQSALRRERHVDRLERDAGLGRVASIVVAA
jgi:hypothetical protein